MPTKVISLRLDPDNPEEARALEIVERWQADGTVRANVTQAILDAGEGGNSAHRATAPTLPGGKVTLDDESIRAIGREFRAALREVQVTTPPDTGWLNRANGSRAAIVEPPPGEQATEAVAVPDYDKMIPMEQAIAVAGAGVKKSFRKGLQRT